MVIFLVQLLSKEKIADESDKMKHLLAISKSIEEGSAAFLQMEYSYLFLYVAVVAVLIYFSPMLNPGDVPEDQGLNTMINFISGAGLSALAGYLGMFTAVRVNVRTTTAAIKGLNPALKLAFKSGSVMGLTVVAFGILGVSANLYLYLDPTVL